MDNFFQLSDVVKVNDNFTALVKKVNLTDYNIVDSDFWIYFNCNNIELPDSGWKGHIAAQPQDIEKVFNISSIILSKENCSFKVARSRKAYKILADTHAPITEANKFMTFYPENIQKFRMLIFKLSTALKEFSAPKIFTDFQLPRNSCIQFRYGAFKDLKFWNDTEKRIVNLVRLPSGKLIEDDRSKPFHMLPDTKWPFEQNKFVTTKTYCPKLNKYRFSEILSRKNKGGVYKGTTDKNVPIVMKTANELVKSGPKKRNAIQLLSNEIKYLKKLQTSPYIPKIVDTFSQDKSLVEIMTFIDGIQLINIKTEDKMKVIVSLIKTVYSLHKQGIIIGDLTNTNFVYSNQKCYLVDLEYMSSIYDPQIREAQTKFYLPDYEENNYETQLEDVYSLAVTIITIIFDRLPKYHANNLMDGAACLMRQLVIAEKLNPQSTKLIKLAEYLLDIVLSNDKYNPEQLNILKFEHVINYKDVLFKKISSEAKNLLLKATVKEKILSLETEYSEFGLAKQFKNITNFGTMTSPISIQSGSIGINVFRGNTIQSQAYSKEKIVAGLKSVSKYRYSDSYLFGYTGLLWEAGNNFLNKKITKSQLNEVIKAFLSMEKDNDNCKVDFALGISGKIYTAVYVLICQKDNNNTLFDYSSKLSRKLYTSLKNVHIKNANDFNQINFAHGLAGEAYSLLVSGLYFKQYKYQKKALELLSEIDNFVLRNLNRIELLNNDPLKYSWCEGASGIGTALVRAIRLTNNTFVPKSLKYIYEFCIHGYTKLESNICHGRNSVIDFLNDYSHINNSFKLKNMIDMLVNFDLISAYDKAKNIFTFFDETGFTNCFDYGVGQVGSICSDFHALNGENRDFYLTDMQEKTLSRNLVIKGEAVNEISV